ncbi:hypothetical protein HPB50_019924 [Hyalomma asiaticum]|uniref:Uncharacterized protein n=1 Tax=Hyalomma asiaticum TaxID=266040 RepID=A0ACB7RKZ8_HYAAI|nr:hypothetical protein HPB50_019924 [Hyalomma asiaticum]
MPSLSQQHRWPKMPLLPLEDFKIVYCPQAGLELANWNTFALMHAIGRASRLPQEHLITSYALQVQRIENLIIASTADKEHAMKLISINRIEPVGTLYNVNGNIRTPDDV